MLVALLALFVALGGPAQARHLIDGKDIRSGTVASAQIKDRSITTRDLSPDTVRALRVTADASIDGAPSSARARRRPAIADGTVAGGRPRRRRGRSGGSSPTARSAPASSPTARSPAPRSRTGR